MPVRQRSAWWNVAIALCTATVSVAQEAVLPRDRQVLVPAVNPSDSTKRIAAVSAVALGQRGEVVLADNKRHELRWFDANGAEIAKRPLKTGSGRVVYAAAIAIAESGEVLVLDRIEYTVHAFARGGQPAAPRTAAAPGFEALNMCYGNGMMLLAGVNNDHLLHAYANGGKRLRSFAEPMGSPAARRAISMSGTMVACSPESDLYVTAYKALAFVRAFRGDGAPAWSYEIPNFRGLDIRSAPDGSVTFRKPRGAADGIRAVAVVGDGRVVVQVARGGSSRLETHVLSAKDGRSLAVDTTIAEIVASGGNRIGIVSNEGRPHVRVFSGAAKHRR